MLRFLLIGLGLFKLAILAIVGPSTAPDTAGYIAFCDAILDGTAFAPVAWGAEATPITVFRTSGYPLILAIAKLITPAQWAALVVVFQGALSITAVILIFRVAERLLAAPGWAVLATLLYGLSQSLLWDNSLLSDSIYSSLFNIVIFALLGGTLGCWRLSWIKVSGLALLWGYSLWTRDNGLYFTFLPVVLLFFIWSTETDRNRSRVVPPIVFLSIVAAMIAIYATFNFYRTGEAFFSITGVQNYLRPLFEMRLRGYGDPFTGDDLIARTVRETMTHYGFESQLPFLVELHRRCHCTPTELQSMALGKLIAEVSQHPIAYSRVVIRNFDYFDLASSVADPVFAINQFFQLGTPLGTRVIPGLSIRHLVALWHHFSASMLVLMIFAGIAKLVSGVVFTLFIVGVPVLFLQRWSVKRPIGHEMSAIGFLWFSFVTVALAFSLIHFEPRHALPVLPAALIGIVYMLSYVVRLRRGDARIGFTPFL